MTRTAYIFLFVVIGLALLLHACDEQSDRRELAKGASVALHQGVKEACVDRNNLRDAVGALAIRLHPSADRAEVRDALQYDNCDQLAREAVVQFYQELQNMD